MQRTYWLHHEVGKVAQRLGDERKRSARYRLAWQSAKRRRGWAWVQRMAERNVAVADDLRGEGWDRGYDAASTCHCAAYTEDECGCGYYGNEPVYRDENPYRRER